MYYNVNNKPSFYDANLRQNAQGSGSTSHFLNILFYSKPPASGIISAEMRISIFENSSVSSGVKLSSMRPRTVFT